MEEWVRTNRGRKRSRRKGGIALTEPLVVRIPHRLGRQEAVRRLKMGLEHARGQYSRLIQVNEEIWSGDRLVFAVLAMKQPVAGLIDVFDDHVRIEVTLPWLLNRIARGLQATIRKQGTLMLTKK
jgi:hypothetical protein